MFSKCPQTSVTVSICFFSFAHTNRKRKYAYSFSHYLCHQERNVGINKNGLKTKLQVYNTISDVAPTHNSQETNCSRDLCGIQNKSSSPFVDSLQHTLSIFVLLRWINNS